MFSFLDPGSDDGDLALGRILELKQSIQMPRFKGREGGLSLCQPGITIVGFGKAVRPTRHGELT
jgi:hypothetical protein